MQAMQDISALADRAGRKIAGSCPPEDGPLRDMIHAYVVYARSHQRELGDNTAAAVLKPCRYCIRVRSLRLGISPTVFADPAHARP
jgi:hypothetical protein